MWLINASTLELKEFTGTPEPYAILSHTWDEDEVSFQDFRDKEKRETQRGFQKIRFTCRQALEDGIQYAWIDTCCINKESSAELSEAINSMFKWYQRALICYAYLDDVSGVRAGLSSLSSSRWFTRGWTLQELIAPQSMEFFGQRWVRLGSKHSLLRIISIITTINIDILDGSSPLGHASVAERMRWASKRQTTRVEDMAYCLMGIFDVNMAMLYGEGDKAFIRLQEEIMKETDDQSLFAWTASSASAAQYPYRGLLASSPAEFASSKNITPFSNVTASQSPLSVTNRGIPLSTSFEMQPSSGNARFIRVALNCRRGAVTEYVVGIELVSRGGDQYVRSCPHRLFSPSSRSSRTAQGTFYVSKATQAATLNMLPLIERQHAFVFPETLDMKIVDVYPQDLAWSEATRWIHLGNWPLGRAVLKLARPGTQRMAGAPRIVDTEATLSGTDADGNTVSVTATTPDGKSLAFTSTDEDHEVFVIGDPDSIFITLQATLDSSGHYRTPSLSMVSKPANCTAEEIWKLHSGSDHVLSTRTPAVMAGADRFEATVEPRKIQGFDVFLVDLREAYLRY